MIIYTKSHVFSDYHWHKQQGSLGEVTNKQGSLAGVTKRGKVKRKQNLYAGWCNSNIYGSCPWNLGATPKSAQRL